MDRHSLDPLSLVSGLAFLAFGLTGALGGLANLDALRVAWPIVLIATGLTLVGSAAAGSRRSVVEPVSASGDPATGWETADVPDLDDSGEPDTLGDHDEAREGR